MECDAASRGSICVSCDLLHSLAGRCTGAEAVPGVAMSARGRHSPPSAPAARPRDDGRRGYGSPAATQDLRHQARKTRAVCRRSTCPRPRHNRPPQAGKRSATSYRILMKHTQLLITLLPNSPRRLCSQGRDGGGVIETRDHPLYQ